MITLHDHATMYRLKMLDFKVKHGLKRVLRRAHFSAVGVDEDNALFGKYLTCASLVTTQYQLLKCELASSWF